MDTDHVHPGDDWLTARGRTLAHKFPTDQQIDKSVHDFFRKLFGGSAPAAARPQAPFAVPGPRLPEGWRQLKEGGAGKPLTPRKESLGIDDPALKAHLAEVMARIKAAPAAGATKNEWGQEYDTPPRFSPFNSFNSGDDVGVLRAPTKPAVPMPRARPAQTAPPITRHQDFSRPDPGQGWTDASQLLNDGAQMIGLRTDESPYDIWFREEQANLARKQAEIDAGVAVDNKSKTPAQLRADRLVTEGTYPRSFRPRGSASSEYASQVPKARRELAETTFARLLGLYDSKGQKASGRPDTGSARNPVGSADKRLKGKRGFKPGEI